MTNETLPDIEQPTNPDQVVIAVDSQVLNAIQQCNTYAQYRFLQLISPNGSNNLSLEMGLVVHKMLEFHYQHKFTLGLNARKKGAIEAGEQYMLTKTTITAPKIFNELKSAYLSYADKYELENFKILGVEEHFTKLMYEDAAVKILYTGLIDLLVERDQIGIIPYDHKTFGSFYSPHGLENQFQGYCWGTGSRTLVVNRIGLGKYLGKFERVTLNFPTDVLEAWKNNAVKAVIDHYNQMVDGEFMQNFSSCGMYRGCDYKMLCSASPLVRANLIRTEYKPIEAWEPLKRDLG